MSLFETARGDNARYPHRYIFFWLICFSPSFVEVQETCFKRCKYALQTLGKMFLPLEEEGWFCHKINFLFCGAIRNWLYRE